MLDFSPRPLDHFQLRSTEDKINRNLSFKFPIPPVRKVFFQVLKIFSSRLQFLLLVAIFIIIILEVPRISVLMPAELTPNNFLFCSKALKFGILYQTQSLRFLHCNRLKRKFLIFYYIDNASCTVRCCVLL